MNTLIRVAGVLAIVGCGGGSVSEVAGNSALGIVRFVVDESPLRTVVRGLDADNKEVGRLELVHGRFRLSGIFAEGYDDPNVDGRKLDVSILGQEMRWQTEGFTPTLHMPSHPPDHWKLAAFLDDPHVAPILRRWQIGFGPIETISRFSQALTTTPDGYTCDDFLASGTHP